MEASCAVWVPLAYRQRHRSRSVLVWPVPVVRGDVVQLHLQSPRRRRRLRGLEGASRSMGCGMQDAFALRKGEGELERYLHRQECN